MSRIQSSEQPAILFCRSPSLESIPSSIASATEMHQSDMANMFESPANASTKGESSGYHLVSSQGVVPLVDSTTCKTSDISLVVESPASAITHVKHQRYCFLAENIHFIVRIYIVIIISLSSNFTI